MTKDTSVNVRLTSKLRIELQRLANTDDRKLSSYIERILQAHVTTLKARSETTKKR